MSHQLALLKRRTFPQHILRILARSDVVLVDLHLRLTLGGEPLEPVESLDLSFELHAHAEFVDTEFVDDLEQLFDKLLLADVLVLAVPVPRL